MTTPIVQNDVQVLDWVEGDASTFTPYPRNVGLALSPAEQARAKWLPVLRQHMTGIVVRYAPAPGADRGEAGTSSAQGQEVQLDHPSFLVVVEAVATDGITEAPPQEERVSYIPWENIVAITFVRRKRVG